METLKTKKRITLATAKAFAKRNADKLYAKTDASFDGMTDCVQYNKNSKFEKTEISDNDNYYQTGIQGFYTVGHGDDYFKIYEDDDFYGIECCNCCGNTIIAVKKETTPEFNTRKEDNKPALKLIKCEKKETAEQKPQTKNENIKRDVHMHIINHAFSIKTLEDANDFRRAIIGSDKVKNPTNISIRELSVKGLLGIDFCNYLLSIVR